MREREKERERGEIAFFIDVHMIITIDISQVAFLLRVDVAITLSYLRLALNPDDSVAFSSVMNKPPRGLPLAVEDALKKVQEDQAMGLDRGTMGGKSLMEIARSVVDPKAGGSKGGLSDTHIKKLSIFINLMDRLADDVSGMSPSESISHILNITGYAAWLKAALDRKKKREKGDEEEESEGGAGPSTSGAAAAKEKGRPSSSEKSQVAEDEEEVEEDEGEEGGRVVKYPMVGLKGGVGDGRREGVNGRV